MPHLVWVLLIVIILLALVPWPGYSAPWVGYGWYPAGGLLGTIIIIVLILALLGRL